MDSLVTDAPSNNAVKILRNKYFGFGWYNKDVRTEPVTILEILSDCPAKRSFLRDEQKCFDHRSETIPLSTRDLSWYLIKGILTIFNKESLEITLINVLKLY